MEEERSDDSIVEVVEEEFPVVVVDIEYGVDMDDGVA